MALLESNNVCAICDEREVRRRIGTIPAYYCSVCFAEYEAEILADASWVRFLMNGEKQRRKRRNRLLAGKTPFAPARPLPVRFH